MNKKVSINIIFIILLILFLNTNALAWDPKSSHQFFSKYAAENSVIGKCIDESDTKCDYLKNIGLDDGLKEFLKLGNDNKEIKDWIAYGSLAEDFAKSKLEIIFGDARVHNHYHNPIRTWYDSNPDNLDAGLDDWVLFFHYTGESSLLWAQDGDYQQNFHEGDWSWEKIRQVYYWALISETDALRQVNFAQTFKGLGHQLHLIQDAAQPEHVRNDVHISSRFEAWTVKEFPKLVHLKNFVPVQDLKFPAMSLDPSQFTLDPSYYDRNLAPSALFIDTDQYKKNSVTGEYNPEITSNTYCSVTQNACNTNLDCPAGEKCVSSIGIAEYTNANFVSPDTIFTEGFDPNHKHYFPYPRYSPDSYEMYEIDIPPDKKRIYLRKKGDGETLEHFATVGPLYKYLSFDPVLQRSELKLDSRVHSDYAQKLIPRAVGYSAGLLNYFFRGEIEAVDPQVIEESGEIAGIKLKVKNNTPDEAMKPSENPETGQMDGSTFIISYRYKASGSSDFVYGTSNVVILNEIIDSGLESTTEFIFNFNGSIPSDAQDVKYWLVYRGKLGNEESAVIGKVIELKMGTFIFLTTSDTSVLPIFVYIRDSKYELKLKENFKIPIKGGRSGYLHWVVVSNPEHTEHFLTFPLSEPAWYLKDMKNYGLGGKGTDRTWRPENFEENSEIVLVTNEYTTLNFLDGDYYLRAMGRHNYTFNKNGKLISKDDSIWRKWRNQDYIYRDYIYRSRTEQSTPQFVGTKVTTTDEFPDEEDYLQGAKSIENTIIATLGKDKSIYVTDEKYFSAGYIKEYVGLRVLAPETSNVDAGDDFRCHPWGQWTYFATPYIRTALLQGNAAKKLRVAGYTIEDITVDFYYGYIRVKYLKWLPWRDFMSIEEYIALPECEDVKNEIEALGLGVLENTTSSETIDIGILDYDNISGDDLFIILYAVTKKSRSYTHTDDSIMRYPGLGTTTVTKTYYLAYKISGVNRKVQLAEVSYEEGEDPDRTFTGFSSQMNNEIMTYTYIIRENDVFQKRIIEIINVSNEMLPIGYRQEFEIPNEEFAIENFDYTAIGAIGIHNSKK